MKKIKHFKLFSEIKALLNNLVYLNFQIDYKKTVQ